MDKPVSYAFSLFLRKYERFLLIAFLVQLPLLMLHSFVTNYIYTATPSNGTAFSVADIYYAFITMLLLFYAMIPFVKYTVNEYEGNENPLKDAFYTLGVQGFQIFVYSAALSLLTVMGFMVFILPGIVVMAMFVSAPIISLMDGKSVWKSTKESVRIFKKHYLKLIMLITGLSLFEFLIGIALNFFIITITSSYLAIVFTQIFLNIIFFPVFAVMLTCLVKKWRDGLNSLDVDGRKTAV